MNILKILVLTVESNSSKCEETIRFRLGLIENGGVDNIIIENGGVDNIINRISHVLFTNVNISCLTEQALYCDCSACQQ